MWLDFWGRTLGIPYRECACMPVGELIDLINVYQIANGLADECEPQKYIPDLR